MLALEGISVVFRSGPDLIPALRKIDLRLAEGEFLTVIGSNGAGKSTLLNVVAGVVFPTSGRVLLRGRDVTSLPVHRRARFVARIVQDPLSGTAPAMTVAENLALAARRRRGLLPAITRRRRAEFGALLQPLGLNLERRLDDPVSFLSGGERQALTVVMMTLSRPEVLLLDEPTAALDPTHAVQIAGLLCRFAAENRLATLLVTHDMDQALLLGERLVMMHRGQILQELSGEEKARATVPDLVRLFSERGVADDRLLLGASVL